MIDSTNNVPLYGITVAVAGTNLSTKSDVQGNFSIKNCPLGQQTLDFAVSGSAVGTDSVNVAGTNDVVGSISLNIPGGPPLVPLH